MPAAPPDHHTHSHPSCLLTRMQPWPGDPHGDPHGNRPPLPTRMHFRAKRTRPQPFRSPPPITRRSRADHAQITRRARADHAQSTRRAPGRRRRDASAAQSTVLSTQFTWPRPRPPSSCCSSSSSSWTRPAPGSRAAPRPRACARSSPSAPGLVGVGVGAGAMGRGLGLGLGLGNRVRVGVGVRARLLAAAHRPSSSRRCRWAAAAR